MTKRIIAIAFIFVCASVAWAILGGTIFSRTYSLDAIAEGRVTSTWGAPHNQAPPVATFREKVARKEESTENGKKIVKTVEEEVTTPLPLERSAVDVGLDLEHRQKGLLWYSTYKVAFAGTYSFRNTTDKERMVDFVLNFPTSQAIYDDLVFTINGATVPVRNEQNAAIGSANVAAGQVALLAIGYRSQGLNEWRYSFSNGDVAQVRDFTLAMKTNFKEIDFPDNTLSPSEKHETGNGWDLTWSYKNLVSGYQIAMVMPEKLQPGPLAGRISFFAPVSLFFFFFLMLIITTMRGIELHPMNYFFLAAAFFSFHLLLAYLVDHVSIHTAFAISAAVSVFLVVSYLRLVVGLHFASREAALAQFVYLVMFSYAFFLKGFTGLAITIGSVATLFVAMQVTGRIRWADKFSLKPPPKPAGELT
ncbi:MAG: inner membrane CreD family protein [Acidobacteriota bacterium]|nr:inner membrane CreD family protein [Acidobacteriota bacterium]MDQ2936766.1 inner membrane CreD family protein [Acidobacteriota bacterium]